MPFKKLREQSIPALQATAEVYEDTTTGAMHYHLATSVKENVFLVAFPTIPDNSDGRAHILEHLALCGSARYPVRDPFFSMTRRSMATFMNAMTYAEKTVYPFASLDKVDYFNLLDVYLDAAFFPNLDYLDFRQEGWRYAYDHDKLVYQGVVFNEMKGAFTNPTRALVQGLESALYENTTYAVVSGGDPLEIPKLTHEDLLHFHKTHYNPSQAVFMTFGDIPADEIQSYIDEKVISKFSERSDKLRPQKAADFEMPKKVHIAVPSQTAKEDEYGIHFAWRLEEMTNTPARYRAELLASALMGDAASPLQMAMESAGFGRPAGYNGLDSSMRQMALYIGMEGLTQEELNPARQLVMDSLKEVAKTGIPHERLVSVLRDFEFQQLEVSGGRRPFGLKRLLEGLPVEMNGGDPLDAWDNTQILAQLRHEIIDPDFIKSMVRDLLANTNMVEATIHPDKEFFAKRDAEEARVLATAAQEITDLQKETILAESAALQARQAAPMNTACLPKIGVSQVRPTPVPSIAFEKASVNDNATCYKFAIASNGVAYLTLTYNVSDLPHESWQWLTLYTDLLPGLGIEGMSFSEAEAWRHGLAPSFRTSLDAETSHQTGSPLRIGLTFSTKGMSRDCAEMCTMLEKSVNTPRFDEYERIQFLIESTYDDAMQSVVENGNAYASNWIRRDYSVNGQFHHTVNGLPYLKFLQEVNQLCQTEEGFAQVRAKLEQLHLSVVASPLRAVVATTPSALDEVSGEVQRLVNKLPKLKITERSSELANLSTKPAHAVLYGKSQVNHCHQAWKAPAIDHPDSSALAVLAAFLENGYLHRALREDGGAYGASASYNGASRVFTMSSYRDPRLMGTYADFNKSVEWMLGNTHNEEALEEAIISTLQGMDRPSSPFGEAMLAVKRDVLGMSEALRERFRHGVIHCTEADLKRVADIWLFNKNVSRCAFLGIDSQLEEAKANGFDVIELADINAE